MGPEYLHDIVSDMERRRRIRSAWDDEPVSKSECLDFYNIVAQERQHTEKQMEEWLIKHPGKSAPTVEMFIEKARERCKELMAKSQTIHDASGQ